MNISVGLDIILGLSLVYFVASIATTSINESIAASLSSRGKWLQRGVASLLSEDPKKLDHKSAREVFNSPFLTYLGTTGIFNTFKTSETSGWALMQGILGRTKDISGDAFASIDSIRSLAEKLPSETPARAIFLDLCARANGDLVEFQRLVDDWHASFVSQLSVWYKQKTQYIIISISIFIAGSMNIDTIDIIQQLSTNPETRMSLATQALSAGHQGTYSKIGQPSSTLDSIDNIENGLSVSDRDKAIIDSLRAAGIHIGWGEGEFNEFIEDLSGTGSVMKILGMLLSAFAIALGAPFWYEVLKKTGSVRSGAQGAGK